MNQMSELMKKLFCSIFLAVLILVGCQSDNPPENTPTATLQPTVTPTNEPTPTPGPTATPTEIPPRVIVPEPMPTAVPNQEALIDENGEVDFVIDWAALEQPVIAFGSENWFKYTPPDGSFSVIIRGRSFITESSDTYEIAPGTFVELNVVETETILNRFGISYFTMPPLTSGEITAEEFLDTMDFDLLRLAGGTPSIVEQEDIVLDGFPGRDYTIEVTVDNPDFPFIFRTRVYVVDDRVYLLIAGGIDNDSIFGEHGSRFLDSFTIHTP